MAFGKARRFFSNFGRRLSVKAGDAVSRLILSRKFFVKHGGLGYNAYYRSLGNGVCYVHRFSRALLSRQRNGIPKIEDVKKILSLIEDQARKKGFKALELAVDPSVARMIDRANAGYCPEYSPEERKNFNWSLYSKKL
jgi:hypothetical protein